MRSAAFAASPLRKRKVCLSFSIFRTVQGSTCTLTRSAFPRGCTRACHSWQTMIKRARLAHAWRSNDSFKANGFVAVQLQVSAP